ncbi:MAG: glycosyltransferase family 2 protein [Arcticibacter sp.]
MKKVSVITVNYNQPEVTETLLQSIAELNKYPAIQVIVVDNGSSINHVPQWTRKYPEHTFIRLESNLGFAGGNNEGVKFADGEYLFFVNNDTEFTEGLVESLVRLLEQHPAIGMVSPKIRYFDQPQTIQYAGFTQMNYYTARNRCIGELETDEGQYDHTTGPTGFIHGAAMMVRRSAIDKAGLMAESFFLYYEEMDWCDRIRRQGFEIWIEPRALIFHKESISVGKKSILKEYFMNRNRMLFIRRNAPQLAVIIFFLYFTAIVVPKNIFKHILDRRYDLLQPLLKALKWNLTNKKDSTNLGYPVHQIK